MNTQTLISDVRTLRHKQEQLAERTRVLLAGSARRCLATLLVM